MMLCIKCLQIYIVISESIIVKCCRWCLMIQTVIKAHVSFDGQLHVPSVYCASKGMVTVML